SRKALASLGKCLRYGRPIDWEIEIARAFAGLPERRSAFNPRYTKCAHSRRHVGHQIPGASLRNQAQRIDRAFAAVAVRLAVCDGELSIARNGILHDGQHRELLARWTPAARVYVKPLADGCGLLTQRSR